MLQKERKKEERKKKKEKERKKEERRKKEDRRQKRFVERFCLRNRVLAGWWRKKQKAGEVIELTEEGRARAAAAEESSAVRLHVFRAPAPLYHRHHERPRLSAFSFGIRCNLGVAIVGMVNNSTIHRDGKIIITEVRARGPPVGARAPPESLLESEHLSISVHYMKQQQKNSHNITQNKNKIMQNVSFKAFNMKYFFYFYLHVMNDRWINDAHFFSIRKRSLTGIRRRWEWSRLVFLGYNSDHRSWRIYMLTTRCHR